jgi:hypothetical protein
MTNPLHTIREWTSGEYTISTDRKRLDFDVIHGFLVLRVVHVTDEI